MGRRAKKAPVRPHDIHCPLYLSFRSLTKLIRFKPRSVSRWPSASNALFAPTTTLLNAKWISGRALDP